MLQVATGEVLVLASHFTYDANRVDEQWPQLLADQQSPLLNRATQGQYPPGSIFKIITASAALDLGIVQPGPRHHHEADLVVDGFFVVVRLERMVILLTTCSPSSLWVKWAVICEPV